MASWAKSANFGLARERRRVGCLARLACGQKLPALALGGALGAAASTSAQCTYTVQIIEAPACQSGFPSPTFSAALNEYGHVVGDYTPCATGNGKAYVWTGGPEIITLQPPPDVSESQASDIANTAENGPLGQIVGQLDGTNYPIRAFVYDNGKWTIIQPPPGGLYTSASATNDNYATVGYQSNPKTGSLEAVMWLDGAAIVLQVPHGTDSVAMDINRWHEAVGWMGNSISVNARGFLWERGEVTDLGVIPGGSTGNARAINGRRQVILNGRIEQKFPEPFLTRAFLWDDGQLIDLGVLPGYDRCGAFDLNDRGEIVGVCTKSQNPNQMVPFIWRDGVMTNLTTLAQPGSNVVLRRANAINEAGQIAAQGNLLPTNNVVAVLLTPVPDQAGDTECDGMVNIDDLWNVIRRWGECAPYPAHCPADFNADGAVNVPDLLTVLMNWS